jgi:hypothetical protein
LLNNLNIRDTLKEVISINQAEISSRNIEVTLKVDDDIAETFSCDENKLR